MWVGMEGYGWVYGAGRMRRMVGTREWSEIIEFVELQLVYGKKQV